MKKVRTLWLSDIHLGNRDCKTNFLLDFLHHHHAETIVLVGDIVDLWALEKRHHWPESHNDIISLLLERAHQGTRVVYVPGNHDATVRQFIKFDFGRIEVKQRFVQESAAGKTIMAMHGDEFDSYVCHSKLHSMIGDVGYDFLLLLNRWWAKCRRAAGLPYWSLSGYLKKRVDKANEAIERFKTASFDFAERRNIDAIVCGHIHHPEIAERDGILYLNDGDWVENCTALVEQLNGEINLVQWTETEKVLDSTLALGIVNDDNYTSEFIKPHRVA
ncbi:UDP-2,3-diacylglucosamine diphosphatase [Thaumasiovibrio subtropicus]|uniref:UDP-2,3-diacylglucosamine diphosphatase n=1 Tax=Thaumasiovibrio subtropicus TaxID=1891207 RepID=UPI000B3572AF|nr:UDP-2,3-diacylglucosamine diphosphatase [Thaumasiovibrio subtropicus]